MASIVQELDHKISQVEELKKKFTTTYCARQNLMLKWTKSIKFYNIREDGGTLLEFKRIRTKAKELQVKLELLNQPIREESQSTSHFQGWKGTEEKTHSERTKAVLLLDTEPVDLNRKKKPTKFDMNRAVSNRETQSSVGFGQIKTSQAAVY